MYTHVNASLLYSPRVPGEDCPSVPIQSFFPCPAVVRDAAVANGSTPPFSLLAVLSYVSPLAHFADADDLMLSGRSQSYQVSMDVMGEDITTSYTLKSFGVSFGSEVKAPKLFNDRGHLCGILYIPITIAPLAIPDVRGCDCLIRLQTVIRRRNAAPGHATLCSYPVRFLPVEDMAGSADAGGEAGA